MFNGPVDFVVLWVDGNDPKLRAKRRAALPQNDGQKEEAADEARFRDFDVFRYWFRAVERYAPWVHRVYLVTDEQKPA